MAKYRVIDTGKKSIIEGYRHYRLERKTLFGWKEIDIAITKSDDEACKQFYKRLYPKQGERIILEFDDNNLGKLYEPKL